MNLSAAPEETGAIKPRGGSEERTYVLHQSRPGKLGPNRAVLRGPRNRIAGCPDPRLPAQWPCLGQAGPDAAGSWPPRHHVRPARVRQIQPGGITRWEPEKSPAI